mmetsp:Transcript_9662/g.16239  ORF Transcript_9662/g.16239 Transcript_9662/m.16239 type:complete len:122 (+) Transcript_9662:337-702(+)
MNFLGDPESSYFNSQVAIDVYNARTSKFRPTGMHIHYPAEHTINGKYIDFEFHIVHYAFDITNPEGLDASIAAIVVQFSVQNFSSSVTAEQNKTMSTFFSQLRLDLKSMEEEELDNADQFG